MTLDDINRVSDLKTQLLAVKAVWKALGSLRTPATVVVPSGASDAISGRDYTIDVVLRGVACVDLRKMLKQEYERLAATLVEFGVEVGPIDAK